MLCMSWIFKTNYDCWASVIFVFPITWSLMDWMGSTAPLVCSCFAKIRVTLWRTWWLSLQVQVPGERPPLPASCSTLCPFTPPHCLLLLPPGGAWQCVCHTRLYQAAGLRSPQPVHCQVSPAATRGPPRLPCTQQAAWWPQACASAQEAQDCAAGPLQMPAACGCLSPAAEAPSGAYTGAGAVVED